MTGWGGVVGNSGEGTSNRRVQIHLIREMGKDLRDGEREGGEREGGKRVKGNCRIQGSEKGNVKGNPLGRERDIITGEGGSKVTGE